jgi:hypothetical protein
VRIGLPEPLMASGFRLQAADYRRNPAVS